MQPEAAVEIDRRAWTAAGPRDRDPPAHAVVSRLGVRDDHAQPIDRAALEDAHQHLAAGLLVRRAHGVGRASEEQWIQAETDQAQRPRLDEHPPRNGSRATA